MKVSDITTRFNAGNPCPVCGTGSKGCSVTADGLHFCRGEPADPPAWIDVSKGEPDNAGFRHFRRAEDRHHRPDPRATFTPPTDWAGKAERFVAALTEALGKELAELLTLPLAALLALRVGWDGGAWTFPECDGTGRTVGIARRFRDGKKKMQAGSNRGLTLPAGWKDRTGAVFVVEGPTDTVAMAHAGLCCVGRPSNSGGADQLAELLADWPKDCGIVVVGENDEKPSGDWPGRAGAEGVGRSLAAKLRRAVRVALPPDGVKDVRQWLTHPDRAESNWPDRGAELRRHLEANAEPIRPSGPPPVRPEWPDPIAAEAFYGLAGDIVRAIAPETEADPAALLFQFLVLCGNIIGRNPYMKVGDDTHHTNEFVVLVGESGSARKGVSLNRVLSPIMPLDPEWAADRVRSGTVSGEGYIDLIRDKNPILEDDTGEPDKRLVILETEFANALKVASKPGSTVAGTACNLWDSPPTIGTMNASRENRRKVTDPHVSLLGHITPTSLLMNLTLEEQANGFANRILFPCVRASKNLPDGGREDVVPAALKERLVHACGYGQRTGAMTWGVDAKAVRDGVYHRYFGPKPEVKTYGLFRDLTARCAGHALRLAIIYAVLDHSATIRAAHYMAALACVDYCRRSVAYIFGDRIGDPVADRISDLLRAEPDGLTRNAIAERLGKHVTGEDLTRALSVLASADRATSEKVTGDGRHAEKWRAREPKNGGVSDLMRYARSLSEPCGRSGISPPADLNTPFTPPFPASPASAEPVIGKSCASTDAPPERPRTPDVVETWLVHQLWHGPKSKAELDKTAKAAGVGAFTKYVKVLHIQPKQLPDGGWEWELPAGTNRDLYPTPPDPPPRPPEPTLFDTEVEQPSEVKKPTAKAKKAKSKRKASGT